MATSLYVKVGDVLYPAEVSGRIKNSDWDDRETKAIHLEMSYEEAKATFVDGVKWSIVMEVKKPTIGADGKPTGETTIAQEEFNNDAFNLSGDITDHRDGTVTVVMGKPTELEDALALLLVEGGNGNV